MRIVEPKPDVAESEAPKKKRSKVPLLLLLLVVAGGAALFVAIQPQEISDSRIEQSAGSTVESPNESSESAVRTGELRIFTDNEFNVFYNNLLQPNLERVENPPSITGDDTADTRIRDIAENRGYRLRASPEDESLLATVDGYLLQSSVDEPWEALQQAATDAGLAMTIVSGYRSVDTQRSIFTSRLQTAGATTTSVAAGQSDDIVDQVLVESSIPGYSKHHTAYTVDLKCAGYVFENFKDSPCFTWLSANNYEKAKEYGFIPSYPPEADAQGPDPEAWEYVYVGKELLTQ